MQGVDWIASFMFLLALMALLHSYVFYPMLLAIKSHRLPPTPARPSENVPLPQVSVLLSVHNEASILQDKLDNLLDLDYPTHLLHFWIGSDASLDPTNEILQRYQQEHPRLQTFLFNTRRGKSAVINDLAAQAIDRLGSNRQHLFLLTDASVMIDPKALYHLAVAFQDQRIGLVDTRMVHTSIHPHKGIGEAENTYINQEVWIKYREGQLWGCMMGPFGGCYALSSVYYEPIPTHHLVDDFYLNMLVLEKGGHTISSLEAKAYEPVGQEMSQEWKRKKRIAAGSFQNLARFKRLLWPFWKPLAFAFWSHKVLRWLGPFWFLLLLVSCIWLGYRGYGYFQLMAISGVSAFLGSLLLDRLLQSAGIHIKPVRRVAYFCMMNLALGAGALQFFTGIQSGIWQPTARTNKHR